MLFDLIYPVIIALVMLIFAFFLYSILSKYITKRRIKKEKELEKMHKERINPALTESSEKEYDPAEEEKIYKEVINSQKEFNQVLEKYRKNKKLEIFVYKILFLAASIIFVVCLVLYVLFYNKIANLQNIIYKIYMISLFVSGFSFFNIYINKHN